MSETVQQLIQLLEKEDVWMDPELKEMSSTLDRLMRNSTQILEKMFLRTIGKTPQSKGLIIEFCVNVVREEMKKLKDEIETKEKEYMDPITLELMRNPVNLHSTGQLYEKESIEKHLRNKNTCPVTGREVEDPTYSTCVSVKKHIDKYVENVIHKTKSYGTLAMKLIQILNIAVINVSNYPVQLKSIEQTEHFVEIVNFQNEVIERVVSYDEEDLELLRIEELTNFYQLRILSLLENRMKILNVMMTNSPDEGIKYLHSHILGNGIINILKEERGMEVYCEEKEKLLKISFDYYRSKKDFPKIISAIHQLALFFTEIDNTALCTKYLKDAEQCLKKDRKFLFLLAHLFETSFRKKKQAANIYFHLGIKFESNNRFSEEVKEMYERSMSLNPKFSKVKARYNQYLNKLKHRNDKVEEEEEKKKKDDVEKNEHQKKQKYAFSFKQSVFCKILYRTYPQ